jgi:hypothetical protein
MTEPEQQLMMIFRGPPERIRALAELWARTLFQTTETMLGCTLIEIGEPEPREASADD